MDTFRLRFYYTDLFFYFLEGACTGAWDFLWVEALRRVGGGGGRRDGDCMTRDCGRENLVIIMGI